MTTDLVLPGSVSETALALPQKLSFEQWEQVGETLARIGRAHQWWVGDWLNYGEAKYGEKYAQAMDATKLEYSTLNSCRYVAQQIEDVRRRTNVSWSHHSEVAALEVAEQEEWLDRTAAEGWSRNQLREHLKATNGDESGRVQCPTCGTVVQADKLKGGHSV